MIGSTTAPAVMLKSTSIARAAALAQSAAHAHAAVIEAARCQAAAASMTAMPARPPRRRRPIAAPKFLMPAELPAQERAALQLELVLDLDHTCVHASAVRGDSRQVADDAHTFTLSNGPGQTMRYKLRTRDGLEAFLREVHGRLPPNGLLMAVS